MKRVVCLMFLFTTRMTRSQEVAPLAPEMPTSPPDNTNTNESIPSLTPINGSLSDEGLIWDTKPGVSDSVPGGQTPGQNVKLTHKPLGAHVLQKLSNFIRRIDEKISRIKAVLYPNYATGGASGNPPHTCDKWNGHQFVTGINGAIYGLSSIDSQDFPFNNKKLQPIEKSNN